MIATALPAACRPRPQLPAPPPPAFEQQGDIFVVPSDSPLRRKLVLATPEVSQVTADTVAPGTVELDPARQDHVLPPLAGRIIRLDVKLGERVHAGQVLAQMVSPDLSQAIDDDDKARSQLDLTRKTRDRAVAVLGVGGGAQKDVEQAQADYAQAQAEAVRTAARLREIGATGRLHGAMLAIRSPRSGEVSELAASTGAYWNDLTAPLMTVADTSTVWVAADVGEDDLPDVHPGQRVEIRFDALPGRVIAGRVMFVAAQLDPDTRRAKVRIALANPGGAFRPNMFATVHLLAAPRRALTVPTTALLFSNSQTHVFVEVAPWRFERRVVEAGIERGDRTVISGNIRPGERIVTRGGVLLDD